MLVEKYICDYGLSDPWDVVDMFEKKLAEYAGSKYAVAVDNCTDAMFLCLKYLKADGEITLPKRTYVSVPCTVIHAGCRVKFEDIEWSGAYQLNPYPVWNMYMPPEQAAEGLELFADVSDYNDDLETSGMHKDLSEFPMYERANR